MPDHVQQLTIRELISRLADTEDALRQRYDPPVRARQQQVQAELRRRRGQEPAPGRTRGPRPPRNRGSQTPGTDR